MVSNAGVAEPLGVLGDIDIDDFRSLLELNVVAPFALYQAGHTDAPALVTRSTPLPSPQCVAIADMLASLYVYINVYTLTATDMRGRTNAPHFRPQSLICCAAAAK